MISVVGWPNQRQVSGVFYDCRVSMQSQAHLHDDNWLVDMDCYMELDFGECRITTVYCVNTKWLL